MDQRSAIARAALVAVAVLGTLALIVGVIYLTVLVGAFAFATPA
jgi:hypothetical protein